MKKIGNLILAFLLLCSTGIFAQMPVLEVGGSTNQDKVYLKNLDIKVDVVGNVSTTTMTMVFQNRTSHILEGTLTFPLPEGATVSGYALDIHGKMRDAVPVDKSKGTQVFEEIERRRVDPGLLEKVEGNNFRTRIYPIPANGNRTISVSYEETLLVSNNKYIYRLPMDFKQAIEVFDLILNVWQDAKPTVDAGKGEISFDKQGNAYVSKFNRTNYLPSKLLAFSVPVASTPEVVMQSASGSYYFAVNCFVKNRESRKKQWANTVGLIWDASLSKEKKDVEKELELLDIIIQEKQNLTIKLGLLSNTFTFGGQFDIKRGDWSALRIALLGVIYDGGTNYSTINLKKIASEEYILFSDGISTLSDVNFIDKIYNPKNFMEIVTYIMNSNDKKVKPIHCVVSSPVVNYTNLKVIAMATNAKFINLNAVDLATAKKEMLQEPFRFLGIKDNATVSHVYPSLPTDINEHISIAGIANAANTSITLQFGYGNTVTEEKNVTLDASRSENNEINVHKLWAQKKITELDLNYQQNKDEIVELSQQFGIVTRNTSLIVLELMSDYIQYGITPPQEMLAEYNQYMEGRNTHREQQLQQMQSQKEDLMAYAKRDMEELKKWWNTDFKLSEPKYPTPDKNKGGNTTNKSTVKLVTPVISKDEEVLEKTIQSDDAVAEMMYDEAELSETVVMGYGTMQKKSIPGSVSSVVADTKDSEKKEKQYIPQQAKITMIDIKNDAEYMKRLTGNPAVDYKIYIEERQTYGGTPSFYFNMSDWFMKHNDREKAIRILTSIAEIGLENVSAYKMLAFRLKEYHETEMLLFVSGKLIEWRPFEQQSYRDYALALKEDGQYQLALDSLYSCILNPVHNTLQNVNLGMNMLLLNDINNIISLHKKKVDIKKVDSDLVYDMPVDVRVVVNWNIPQTHIDMQITDPRGEMVTYNHNRSLIGGRLDAHEIMDYGPEQFLLKKGMKGKYTIQVDYWGDSNVSSTTEPATIMTEIYISYSTGKEERKIVCFNLSNANIDKAQKKVTIAEFEI